MATASPCVRRSPTVASTYIWHTHTYPRGICGTQMSQARAEEECVRFRRVKTPRELEACLASLPAGVRFGIACELDEKGQALRLDACSCSVYHLRWDRDDLVVLAWGPMSSLVEAATLLSKIKTLDGSLDENTAVQLYRMSTCQRVALPAEPARTPPVTPPSLGSRENLKAALPTVQRALRYLRARWRPAIQPLA